MRTWMRRGIPAVLLAGGVLAMSAGNAAAAPAPIGDPTGLADTALRLADIVGHKGLPPLPDTSQIQLPTAPIGQSQRSLDPQGLAGGGLSLSNVQLNGQDLPKPQLPGLPALPGLGGGDPQRSLDPTHIAISDVPQLQQLPKLPSLASGLPVSVLPDMSTSRALPNLTYSGVVPTGGLHNLTQLPDLSGLPLVGGATGERDLPGLPALPKLPLPLPLPGASAERDLPGLSLLGALPVLGGQQRALPAVPGLEMVQGLIASTPLAALLASTPLGSVAGRDLPALPALPLHLPALPGAPAGRDLPGLSLLGALPGLGALGMPADAETTGTDADATDSDVTPDTDARELPVVDSVLPKLPLAVPAVPGASLNGFHGIPALGPSFTTTLPANDSARSVVPGVPSTTGLLGGLLGHAPRLPISGI